MPKDGNNPQNLPNCTKKHPNYSEVREACQHLVTSCISCCKTVFQDKYPDLYNLFDPTKLKGFLNNLGTEIRKELEEQGIGYPKSVKLISDSNHGHDTWTYGSFH
jgi:hypothetical protein